MNNLSEIFDKHKNNVVDFIDGVRNEAYKQGGAETIDRYVENVLYELNRIAEDESYYFDKDNANLVSSVMYGQLEQLKERINA